MQFINPLRKMLLYTSSSLFIPFISLRLQSCRQSLEISLAVYINQSLYLSAPTILSLSLFRYQILIKAGWEAVDQLSLHWSTFSPQHRCVPCSWSYTSNKHLQFQVSLFFCSCPHFSLFSTEHLCLFLARACLHLPHNLKLKAVIFK